MKTALLTTIPDFSENKRIKAEIEALGHEFTLLDMSHFQFKVVYGEKIYIPKLTDEKYDVIIVRGILQSIKAIAEIIKHVQTQGTRVFDNNLTQSLYAIDKVNDLLKLSINEVETPETFYGREFSLYRSEAKKIGYPVIVKSIRSGKGASVFKVENENELTKLITTLQEKGKEAKSYLVQEFIPYEYDLRVLIIGDEFFTMRRIPQEGEFRANFSLGGSVEPFDLSESDKELAQKALSAVKMSVGGVDILKTPDKSYIIEVNHTPGFIGMELALQKNIGKVYVEHAIKNAK